MQKFFTWCIALLWTIPLFGQVQTPVDIALRLIEKDHLAWGLSDKDVSNMAVSDMHTTEATGVTHLVFNQQVNGVSVYNALLNVQVSKTGEAFMSGNRFVVDAASLVKGNAVSLTAEQAVVKAATALGIEQVSKPRLKEKVSETAYRFEKGNYSNSEVLAVQRYQVIKNSKGEVSGLYLSWDLALDMPINADYLSVRVDAASGQILNKNNFTVYCHFEGKHEHREHATQMEFTPVKEAVAQLPVVNDNAQYRVFAWPAESPSHGTRVMEVNPADPLASPFGWHDTNGATGPEYMITRGNNVHAYLDEDDSNTSKGDEPNGGASLIFDFPYQADWEPTQYKQAAVTNLFYAVNKIHDFTYHHGFTGAGGNFQANNYGLGGAGGDYVNAEAQDGGGVNNANFSTPADGGNGRMQMYLWDRSASGGLPYLQVTAPTVIAGGYATGLANSWGAPVTSTPVSGVVAIAQDAVENPYFFDACETLTNAAALSGKIALIDRGGCEFGAKALRAQEAGAIGVIICNFEDVVMGMGAGAVGGQVTIPAVFVSSSTCQQIRTAAQAGTLSVSIVSPADPGPENLDGDFDNGIIAHEFGHGVSNRLTGGPSAAGCLGGEEQMGEGWSDFMTLVTTVKLGDTKNTKRGVGTFVQREMNSGKGIRSFPYSADMTINPLTYVDIRTESVPHGVGAVWCSMLWDMYWAFVELDGYDADITNTESGNYKAISLVMDGMKMQACNPGFIDGRDAILLADRMRYNGEHQCMIWEVFAKRGLGYNADQGSSDSRGDGTEDFEVLPTCIQELKIKKSVTDNINPGEQISVTLTITNHKPNTVTSVKVSDKVPAGASFVAGSSTVTPSVSGNNLTFDLGDMDFEEVKTISYKLNTDPSNASIRAFFDDVPTELAEENWTVTYTGTLQPNIWSIQDVISNSPSYAWFTEDIALESRQILQLAEPVLITGTQPTLRFYHSFETEAGADGGLVEISTNGGMNWTNLTNEMFRNGYTGPLQYGTFVVPNIFAFSGNSDGFIPTYVDLSAYTGQEVVFRFRFGTDDNTSGLGWFVDDIEIMDLKNYNTEACASSADGDNVCVTAPSRGTLVETSPTNTTETNADFAMRVFPNPAVDRVNLQIKSDAAHTLDVTLFTLDGKAMKQLKLRNEGQHTYEVRMDELPSGMYLLQVQSDKGTLVEKIVKR